MVSKAKERERLCESYKDQLLNSSPCHAMYTGQATFIKSKKSLPLSKFFFRIASASKWEKQDISIDIADIRQTYEAK